MANLMRTSNPALNEKAFKGQVAFGEAMTLQGTVNKTGLLLLCVVATAAWTWGLSHPLTAPLYALLEGLALGGISAMFERTYPGVAMQAIGLTFGTLFVILLAYKTGMIRATQGFKLGVIAATGGIALLYIVEMILGGFFHIQVPAINGSGAVGIGFSLFVVVIAALNLVLDFDMIETGVQNGAPKYMEWYGAFAMMVTLIWLYLEILRLLGKARRR